MWAKTKFVACLQPPLGHQESGAHPRASNMFDRLDCAVKSHYVPKFLLKSWCTRENAQEAEQLWACSRSVAGPLRHKRFSPSGTGWQKDLYALQPEHRDVSVHEHRDAVEEGYSALESEAARVHAKLLEGVTPSQLTPTERGTWAQFLATLEHRSPRKIREMVEFLEPTLEKIKRDLERLNPQIAEVLDANAVARNEIRTLPLSHRVELAEVLLGWQWLMIHLSVETGACGLALITADYPLTFLDIPDGRLLLLLALSPQHLFVATPAKLSHKDLDAEFAVLLISAACIQLICQKPNTVYSRERLENRSPINFLKVAEDCLEIPQRFTEEMVK